MLAHLYLDIDGVLIADRREGPEDLTTFRLGSHRQPAAPVWSGGYVSVPPHTWAQVAPAMVETLNALIRRYGLQGHWVSSWSAEAPALGESVGLRGSGEWPVLEVAARTWGSRWSKLRVVRDHIAQARPAAAVWIDDQLRVQHEAKSWALHAGVQAIAPDAVQGVSPKDLQVVEHYLARRLGSPGG
ncbi:HAD domain-containing protein [Sinomonas soli]